MCFMHYSTPLVFLFLLFGIHLSLSAQADQSHYRTEAWPGSFVQLDFDCGGYVSGFAAQTDGRLYCKANVGGLYRSDDHGETWIWLASSFKSDGGHLPQGVLADPDVPDRVWQALGTSYFPNDPERGIWQSDDAGITWHQVLKNVNFSGNDEAQYGGPCLVMNPLRHDELWAISRGDGLWSSQDRGCTWKRLDKGSLSGFVGTAVLLDPQYPEHVFVAGEGGVWYSPDRGNAWQLVTTMGRCSRLLLLDRLTMLVAGSTEGKPKLLRLSAQDWNTPSTWKWKDESAALADCWTELDCLTRLRGTDTIFCGSNISLKVSRDLGTTWKPLDAVMDLTGPQPIWQRPGDTKLFWGKNEILQDPLDPNRLYLASGLDFLISPDQGKTWRHGYKGIAMTCTYKAEFHPGDPNFAAVPAMDQYCLINRSGAQDGSPWECLASNSEPEGVASGARILLADRRGVLLYTRFGNNGARIGLSDDLFRTWKEIKPLGLPLEAFVDGAISPGAPDDFLVVAGEVTGPGKGGIYRTRDGGKTFVQASGIPSGVRLGYYWSVDGYHDLYADPAQAGTYHWWLDGKGYFRSTDGGSTWSFIARPGKGVSGQLAMSREGELWLLLAGKVPAASKDSCLWHSADRGNTWTPVGQFGAAVPRIDAQGDWVVISARAPGDAWNMIWLSGDRGRSWQPLSREGFWFPTVNGLALNPWKPGEVWISTNGRSNAIFRPKNGN